MTELDAVLKERKSTHGDFTDQARVTQRLKDVLRDERKRCETPVTAVQEEALAMILHKIGRIIAGNPNVKDHWDDIAGYATITSQRTDESEFWVNVGGKKDVPVHTGGPRYAGDPNPGTGAAP